MDHVATVLGAVYPDGKDAFLFARERLPLEYLNFNPLVQKLWEFTGKFVDKFGVMPTTKVMKDFMQHTEDAGTANLMLQIYAGAVNASVNVGEFKYSVDCLVDNAQKQQTGEIFATAFEILERGYSVDGERLEGHTSAREFLTGRISSMEKEFLRAETPEGNVADEVDEILAEYEKAKNRADSEALPTGFPTVDKVIGGLRPGDLTLIASYTSGGKSQLCVNWSYNAFISGRGVFYATTETTRAQIRARFLARHSRASQFNCPGGLDHSQITRGKLSTKHEEVLRNVLEDIKTNPNYGKFHIAQLPSKPTLAYIEQRMLREQQKWNVDLLTVDSLNLLRPDEKRASQREELVNILTSAQTLSSAYNGTGVAILSPWQVGREAHVRARTTQTYELNDLAEASEAEKSSDYVFSLFYDDQESTKTAYLKAIKTRGTAKPPRVTLDVDYKNSYFSESGSGIGSVSTNAFGQSQIAALGVD